VKPSGLTCGHNPGPLQPYNHDAYPPLTTSVAAAREARGTAAPPASPDVVGEPRGHRRRTGAPLLAEPDPLVGTGLRPRLA